MKFIEDTEKQEFKRNCRSVFITFFWGWRNWRLEIDWDEKYGRNKNESNEIWGNKYEIAKKCGNGSHWDLCKTLISTQL